MPGVAQGHSPGSLFVGSTALVFLLPVCANRAFGDGSRGDDPLQTGPKATCADGNRIPQTWDQGVCSHFRALYHAGTKNTACAWPLVTSSQQTALSRSCQCTCLPAQPWRWRSEDALLLEELLVFFFPSNDSNLLFLVLISYACLAFPLGLTLVSHR